jgi:hypothetical protein
MRVRPEDSGLAGVPVQHARAWPRAGEILGFVWDALIYIGGDCPCELTGAKPAQAPIRGRQ